MFVFFWLLLDYNFSLQIKRKEILFYLLELKIVKLGWVNHQITEFILVNLKFIFLIKSNKQQYPKKK